MTHLPNNKLHPNEGDAYILYGFDIKLVNDKYIPEAEEELYSEAIKWIKENYKDTKVYECPTIINYFYEHKLNLDLGQKIKLVDSSLENGSRSSRIIGFEKKLINIYDAIYTIGDNIRYSNLSNLKEEVKNLKADQYYIAHEASNKTSVITQYDSTKPTDRNVLSSLRSLNTFLRKDKEDSTEHLITFLAGLKLGAKYSLDKNGNAALNNIKSSVIESLKAKFHELESTKLNSSEGTINTLTALTLFVKNLADVQKLDVKETATILNAVIKGTLSSPKFVSGFLGEGFRIAKSSNGDWNLEIDNLTVRKVFQVFELLIQEVKHQGGVVVHSPAGGKITKVTDGGSYWKCEVESADTFFKDDLVLCQKFTGKNIKRYWRLATSAGEGFVNLSKTDCEPNSATPEEGDEIATLGNKANTARQSAYLISVVGADAPYTAYYSGINSYSLTGKEHTRIGNLEGVVSPVFGPLKGSGAHLVNAYVQGLIHLQNGKSVETVINETSNKLSSDIGKVQADLQKDINTSVNSVKSELGATITGVENNFNTSLNSTKNELNSSISKVQGDADAAKGLAQKVQDAVDGLEIGGRNLVLNTSDDYKQYVFGGWQRYFNGVNIEDEYIGKTIIGRAFIAPDSEDADVGLMLNFNHKDDPMYTQYQSDVFIKPNEKGWVTVKAIVLSKFKDVKLALRHKSGATPKRTVSVKKVKMEVATTASDWTPAPEDTEAQISKSKEEAEAAAKAYADAQDNLKQIESKAYADGRVSEEEKRAIADAKAKLDAAKAYADAQDAVLKAQQEAYADGKITAEEQRAIEDAKAKLEAAKKYADAQDALLKTQQEAYADGIVTEAEQRAINEAQNRVDKAKEELNALIEGVKETVTKEIKDVEQHFEIAEGQINSHIKETTQLVTEAKLANGESIKTLEQVKVQINDINVTAGKINTTLGEVTKKQGEINSSISNLEQTAGSIKTSIEDFKETEAEIKATANKIEATHEGIVLEASEKSAQKAIGGLEIGGRNLMLNSKEWELKAPPISGGPSANFKYLTVSIPNMAVGDIYTVTSNVEVLEGSTDFITIYIYPSGVKNDVKIINGKIQTTLKVIHTANKNILIYAGRSGETASNHIKYTETKIEKGTKPTDWTPAPEDIDAQFTETKASLKVLTDQITSEVSKTNGIRTDLTRVEQGFNDYKIEIVGDINNAIDNNNEVVKASFTMNGNKIGLLGSVIDLTGKVTFSALNTEAQGKINNATRTANNAAQDIFDLKLEVGDLAYLNTVEKAQLGTTVIEGGFLKTDLIQANSIKAEKLDIKSLEAVRIRTSNLDVLSGATIAGFEIGNGRIGAIADPNSSSFGNLAIYKDFFRVGGNNGYAMLGENVIPLTAGGAFTAVGRIVNNKPNKGGFGYDNANYGLFIDVTGGEKNYGIHSNASILSPANISTKVATWDFNGATYTIDFSQASVFIMSRTRAGTVKVTMPTESSVASQFGMSTLPVGFGFVFTVIAAAETNTITLTNLHDRNHNLDNFSFSKGDNATILAHKTREGFEYQLLTYNT